MLTKIGESIELMETELIHKGASELRSVLSGFSLFETSAILGLSLGFAPKIEIQQTNRIAAGREYDVKYALTVKKQLDSGWGIPFAEALVLKIARDTFVARSTAIHSVVAEGLEDKPFYVYSLSHELSKSCSGTDQFLPNEIGNFARFENCINTVYSDIHDSGIADDASVALPSPAILRMCGTRLINLQCWMTTGRDVACSKDKTELVEKIAYSVALTEDQQDYYPAYDKIITRMAELAWRIQWSI